MQSLKRAILIPRTRRGVYVRARQCDAHVLQCTRSWVSLVT